MAYEPPSYQLDAAEGYLALSPDEFDDRSQDYVYARTDPAFASASLIESSGRGKGRSVVMVGRSRSELGSGSVAAMTLEQLGKFLTGRPVEEETEGEDYASNSVNLPWWITLPAALLLVVGIVFVGLFAAGTIDLGDYRFMGVTGAVLVTLGNLFLTFRIFHYPLLIVIGFIIAITGLVLWSLALANRP